MRINLRVVLAGLVALVAIGPAWPGLLGSGAMPANGKTKSVTLVIDFGADSGRPVQSFELASLPSEMRGWDLFDAAKLKVQGTDQFPRGFVCRIDGWPNAESQDCTDTPAFSEGHWAYYVTNVKLGSGWMLSGQGAATHKPDCAGYEGWSWVAGNQEAQAPRFKTSSRRCD